MSGRNHETVSFLPRPALQSCKHQRYEAAKDLLSQLPDDILFIIMSLLTTKEAARTSLLSRRWNYLWRCFPILIFEDLSAMERTSRDHKCVPRERSIFCRRVDQVIDAYLGQDVDELRVTFGLDKRCQSHIPKWLSFALLKNVKRLALDFTQSAYHFSKPSLPKWRLFHDQPHNLSCLQSLSLTLIDLTTKDIDCILRSCSVLENLCIQEAPSLRCVKAFDLPLQLKHLKVSDCDRLKIIDILAPKLLSFGHHGYPIELHIRNASFLSNLSLGFKSCKQDIVTYAFESLSKYFSQLEKLSWELQLFMGGFSVTYCDQFNLGIRNPPVMTNLKHLQFDVYALCDQSFLGWADLIEASPILERLTFKIYDNFGWYKQKIMKRNGRPLKSLKTLELINDVGLPIDIEFATYVIENSIMLKDVIVKVRPLLTPLASSVSVEDQIENVKRIVPQGVNFTLIMVDKWEY